MASNWSGSPAGYIPLSKMTKLRSDIGPGGYAQPDAALAFLAMAPEFELAVGVPLKFTEAYRDYATSVFLFVSRHTRVSSRTGIFWDGSYWVLKPGQAPAGIPGTSFHLEGLAIDFAYPLTSWTTPGQKWFRANEARFGFSSAQGVADGEPWHKRYIGSTHTSANSASTPLEEEDMPLSKEDLQAIWTYPLSSLDPVRFPKPYTAAEWLVADRVRVEDTLAKVNGLDAKLDAILAAINAKP